MRHRHDLVELFSTFLQFETEQKNRWTTDSRLRRSMQSSLARSPETSERAWTLYWHGIWQASAEALAGLHLTAYLQEPCYWAAQRTLGKTGGKTGGTGAGQYTLPDYFQMAIAEVQTVLGRFEGDRGSSLRSFGEMVFQGLLRDALRQRQIADLCTDWALLRKISKKRLGEALEHGGLGTAAIAQYRLAWICFTALYVPTTYVPTTCVPTTGRLPQPDAALWEAIAQLYNAERLPTTAPVTAATIEQWLSRCANWTRSYLYPPVASLNAPRNAPRALGEETGEVQDALPDRAESPLSAAIAQEELDQRQQQRSQLGTVLEAAIEQLEPQSQTILRLYYQQDLTQQQIMKALSLSQASVSRRLSKSREALLIALVQWSQMSLGKAHSETHSEAQKQAQKQATTEPLNHSVNNSLTPALIGSMGTALEEWLRTHYARSDSARSDSAQPPDS